MKTKKTLGYGTTGTGKKLQDQLAGSAPKKNTVHGSATPIRKFKK